LPPLSIEIEQVNYFFIGQLLDVVAAHAGQ
jgi:hypothetical protein